MHCIKFENAFVTLAGDNVVANKMISKSEASSWIIEQKDDAIYGLVFRRDPPPLR